MLKEVLVILMAPRVLNLNFLKMENPSMSMELKSLVGSALLFHIFQMLIASKYHCYNTMGGYADRYHTNFRVTDP